jgi:hypothetical protein
MATDIVREIDPNWLIPEGLKGAVERTVVEDLQVLTSEQEEDVDIQNETTDEEDSELDEDAIDDAIEAPDEIVIVSQTIRTDPSGRQVIDVVIDVAEVEGAVKYDVRITKV